MKILGPRQLPCGHRRVTVRLAESQRRCPVCRRTYRYRLVVAPGAVRLTGCEDVFRIEWSEAQ